MDNSRHEKKVPDSSIIESTGTGRSYECNFCKRGFTNAQALGGHMNIHRKEKAKASKQSDAFHRRSFSNPFLTDQESSKCAEANYGHQFHMPLPNPSQFPYACYQSDPNAVVASSKNLGSSLSLDMGSWRSSKDDEVGARDETILENELDLELRLGHDPAYSRPNN